MEETENPRWRRLPPRLVAEVIPFVVTISYLEKENENEFIIAFYPTYPSVKDTKSIGVCPYY